MYHSVTFGSKNTFTDWHLVPDGRPVISMPELKTITVDIPGRSGVLDLSQAVSKYPVYKNRTGTLSFHVLNNQAPWQELYRSIAEYVHGKTMDIRLEDDPNWYYHGRIYVNEWKSNNDGTWSDISFNYDLDPYKLANTTARYERWLWDPFSFVNGVIRGSIFNDISVNSTNYTQIDLTNLVGRMPVTPTFYVTSTGGLDFHLYNSELGISVYKTGIKTGTYTWPEVVFSELTEDNDVHIDYKKSNSSGGTSKLSIDYRRGSL